MKEVKDVLNYNIKRNDLYDDFDKALEDDTFARIVHNLNLPKDVLVNYTSLIKDSATELKNCRECKNIMECKNNVNGYVYYPSVSQEVPIFSYVPCKYKKKLDKDNSYLNNVVSFDMPKDVINASMRDIYTDDDARKDVIKWLTMFIKNYQKDNNIKGLYLTGNFGCGKTYLVSAMFNELAKKGYKVAIIYYPEFLRSLKESFNEDVSFSSRFNTIKKADLLLLDDIGAESISTWNRDEILSTILQYRMQEKLPTFFTSNLTIEELEVHLMGNDREGKIKARRIIERIKYLTDNLVMVAENRRK